MADERLRRLQRRAVAGDLDARAEYLLERVRLGTLPAARLELLAFAQDPAACRALGHPVPRAGAPEKPELITFRQRLAATIVWCRERGDAAAPQTSLRSAALRIGTVGYVVSQRERMDAVARIAEERVRRLEVAGWVPWAAAHGLAGGRLLIFDPDSTLSDGAANLASGGLFDDDNIPPWDTWLHYAFDGLPPGFWRGFRSYAVSYLPPCFLDAGQAGIEVNPEQCLAWADQHDGPFVRALTHAGLSWKAP